jgi:regulator of sirC expression with transglutaminase-like and TPR domain
MASDTHRTFARAVQCPEDEIDLGQAALSLAHWEYPDLDIESYVARMDRLAETVKDRAGEETNPYRLIASINYVLFNQEGFQGNREDYYDSKNSFLNEVMERKTGIPITLSVLYMEIARRVGLILHGVAFPGHFLIKYVGKEEEIIIDPFHAGEVRSVDELQDLLDEIYGGKVSFQAQFLSPVSKKQILKRMLNNLKAIYLHQGDLLRALSVVERLVVLEPNSPQEIRDRGLLYLKLECFPQALEDLEAYLRLAFHAEDAEEIREHVLSLKKRETRIH